MRSKFFMQALATISLLAACSQQDTSPQASNLQGFGEEEPEVDPCATIPEGQDSLVGQYQQIGLAGVDKNFFPDIPFAFVADGGSPIPAISRAIRAVVADPINSFEGSDTRNLYLTPNVKSIIKLVPNQTFLFGTEKRWIEVSSNFEKKSLVLNEYVKGQTRPVSFAFLGGNHEFVSNSLRGENTLGSTEFMNRQLYVIEKLDETTFSFEFKYNGVAGKVECFSFVVPNTLESVWGYGPNATAAKANLQATCEAIQKLPGNDSLYCETVQAAATCQDRRDTEYLDADIIAKPSISAECLNKGFGDSAKYLAGPHELQPSQTGWPTAIARAQTNYDHFFVSKVPASENISIDIVADAIRKDFKSYVVNSKPEENTTDIVMGVNDVVYIGHTTSLPGVGQYLEIRPNGRGFTFSTWSFGGFTERKEVAFGDAKSGYQLLYGISNAISFNYAFEELPPYDHTAFHVLITPEILNLN